MDKEGVSKASLCTSPTALRMSVTVSGIDVGQRWLLELEVPRFRKITFCNRQFVRVYEALRA